MRRLEEYLRGPLDDQVIIAELALAMDAVGTFPSLLEPPSQAQQTGSLHP